MIHIKVKTISSFVGINLIADPDWSYVANKLIVFEYYEDTQISIQPLQ